MTPASPPPWLFGIIGIPFGVAAAFASVAVAVVLEAAHVPTEKAQHIIWLTMFPPWLQLFYAPLIDLGPRRKIWLVILSILGGLCIGGAMFLPLPSSLGLFTVLVVAGQALTGLTGACTGALVATTMPAALRDKTSGWTNAANLGSNVLGGGLVLTVARLYSLQAAGIAIAAMIILPSLVALRINEAPRAPHGGGEVFGTMFRDLWNTARTRHGWSGLLFCISPVGTACLLNLFSSLAPDYHANPKIPELVNGYGGGLITAAGALASSYLILNRMNRRTAYVLSGLLTAVCCFALYLAPLNPTVYIAGSLVYLLITGLCYASFTAVAYDIASHSGGKSAGMQYTLCTAAGNFAIFYVTRIDNWGYAAHKTRGLLAADGLSNLVGACFLGGLLYLLARSQKHASDPTFVRSKAS